MEKNNLQTTVKQLEEFLSAYYRKTGVRPTLGEALDMMEKDNLLSAPAAVAAADSKVQHTVEEICDLMAEPIAWAPGLILKGAGFEGNYYMKD